jgi:hypothetical protein
MVCEDTVYGLIPIFYYKRNIAIGIRRAWYIYLFVFERKQMNYETPKKPGRPFFQGRIALMNQSIILIS